MSHKDIPALRIVLYGLDFVGKTAFIRRYDKDEFSERCPPTIGVDFCVKRIVIDQQTYRYQIWDTCGLERFWQNYFCYSHNAHACVLMYSIIDQKSFDVLTSLKEQLFPHLPTVDDAFPLILVGTKADLDSTRVVEKETAEQWCKNNGILAYFEVSSKHDVGVDEAFSHVAHLALKHKNLREKDRQVTAPVVLTTPTDGQPGQKGCY